MFYFLFPLHVAGFSLQVEFSPHWLHLSEHLAKSIQFTNLKILNIFNWLTYFKQMYFPLKITFTHDCLDSFMVYNVISISSSTIFHCQEVLYISVFLAKVSGEIPDTEMPVNGLNIWLRFVFCKIFTLFWEHPMA